MPITIPVIDQSGAQSRGFSTPGPQQINPDTAVAEAVGRVGEQVGAAVAAVEQRAEASRQKAIALDVASGHTALQRAIDGEMSGSTNADGEREAGYLETQGLDANKNAKSAIERAQQRRNDIAQNLGSPEARAQFVRESDGTLESTRRTIEQHSAHQFRLAQQGSALAQRASSLNFIAKNYANDEAVADQAEITKASLRKLSPGKSKEEQEAIDNAYDADVAKTRLNQFIGAHDITGARALFSQTKDVLGVQAVQFQKLIEAAEQDQKGELLARDVFSKAIDPVSGWVDAAKARAELDKMPPSPIYDEARQRLDHRIAVAKQEKAEAIGAKFDQALKQYRAAGTLTAVEPALRIYLQDDKNDPRQWEALRGIAKADAAHARGLPETPEQSRALTEFLVDLNDNPDKYATMSPSQFESTWAPRLSKSDRERAGAVLAGAHGKVNKQRGLSPLETKVVLQAGRDAGIFDPKKNDVSKWDDDQAGLFYAAVQQVEDLSAAYRKAKGEAPPVEKVQEWMKSITLKGKVPDSGIIRDDRMTRIEAERKGVPFVPEWEDADRARAAKALQSAGSRVDDATIELYLRRKHGLPAAPATAPTVDEETPPIPTYQPEPAIGD